MELGYFSAFYLRLSFVVFTLRWMTWLCFYIILLGWVFELGNALFD